MIGLRIRGTLRDFLYNSSKACFGILSLSAGYVTNLGRDKFGIRALGYSCY